MSYNRFTLPLRYQLQALVRAKHALRAIAEQLGVHRTTIARELSRAVPYEAELAHQHAHDEQNRSSEKWNMASVWTCAVA